MKEVLLSGLVSLSVGCAASIGDGGGNGNGSSVPDSGLGPGPSADGGSNPDNPDAAPQLEGTALLLAPASNTELKNVALLSAADGSPAGVFIAYKDFPELASSTGYPQQAAQAPDGNVYVMDTVGDAVYIFSPTRQLVGQRTLALGATEAPKAIDFNGGELWVATNLGRVLRYSETGKALDPKLVLPGEDRLEDLLVLSDGSFLVSNATADQVQHYGANGVKIRDVYGINSPEQIQQLGPDEFAVTAYIDDAAAFFKLDGTQLSRLDGLSSPQGIAKLGNGNYAITIRVAGQACNVGNECLIQQFGTSSSPISTLTDGPLVRRLEKATLEL